MVGEGGPWQTERDATRRDATEGVSTADKRVKSSRKDRREVTDVSPVFIVGENRAPSTVLPVSAAQSTFSAPRRAEATLATPGHGCQPA